LALGTKIEVAMKSIGNRQKPGWLSVRKTGLHQPAALIKRDRLGLKKNTGSKKSPK